MLSYLFLVSCFYTSSKTFVILKLQKAANNLCQSGDDRTLFNTTTFIFIFLSYHCLGNHVKYSLLPFYHLFLFFYCYIIICICFSCNNYTLTFYLSSLVNRNHCLLHLYISYSVKQHNDKE